MMNASEQIAAYLTKLASPKGSELKELYQMILTETGEPHLHFFDGKNVEGKVVANPTIGFGQCRLSNANGQHQDTFRLGISANSNGISIYIIGLKDKSILQEKFNPRIGKAKITGYCIRFKSLIEIDRTVLTEVFSFALKGLH